MKRLLTAAALLTLIAVSGCKPVDYYIAPNVPELRPALEISNHANLTPKEQEQLDTSPATVNVGGKPLAFIKATVIESEIDNAPSNAPSRDHVRIVLDTTQLGPTCETTHDATTDCISVVSITSSGVPNEFVMGSSPTPSSSPTSGETDIMPGGLINGRSVIEFDAADSYLIKMTIGMNSGENTTFDAKTGAVIMTDPDAYVAKGPVA